MNIRDPRFAVEEGATRTFEGGAYVDGGGWRFVDQTPPRRALFKFRATRARLYNRPNPTPPPARPAEFVDTHSRGMVHLCD